MAIRRHAPEFRPWMEHVAGAIGDPVKRLRFLRAVAPVASAAERPRRRWRFYGRIAVLLAAGASVLIFFFRTRAAARVPLPVPVPAIHAPALARPKTPEIWRVDAGGDSEVYSNGLRIEAAHAVSHRPRSYLVFPAAGSGRPVRRADPAGIVFHSTESQEAPFEAGNNETIKRIGESLLDYVRRRRCYHFLIDRFGRVYRVVAESDAANHAGYSVWADEQWLYLNLNESFLGVAFEARTRGKPEPEMTAAQARSGVMLTEMLRARYRIPASNCVTHAQVSVNPSNMRAGYHVDWAADFPFEDLGLPDNYAAALPSVWAFGFECDPGFASAATGRLRNGIAAADRLLERHAAAAGLRPAVWRKQLQQQYRARLQAVRRFGSGAAGAP